MKTKFEKLFELTAKLTPLIGAKEAIEKIEKNHFKIFQISNPAAALLSFKKTNSDICNIAEKWVEEGRIIVLNEKETVVFYPTSEECSINHY